MPVVNGPVAQVVEGAQFDPFEFDAASAELEDIRLNDDGGQNCRIGGQQADQAAVAIKQAADALRQVWTAGQPPPANSNYGVVPNVRVYEGLGAPLDGDIDAQELHVMPQADLVTQLKGSVTAADSPAKAAGKRAMRSAGMARLEARGIRGNTGVKQLRGIRDAVGDHARTARAEARAARAAVDNPGPLGALPSDPAAAEIAQRLAERTEALAKSIDRYTSIRQARVAKIGTLIGLTIGGVLSGALTWVFVFGAGRKIVKDGAARFDTKDLTATGQDTDNTISVNVVKQNGELLYVAAVHLFLPKGTNGITADQVVDTFADKAGNWKVNGNSIEYTPTDPTVTPVEIEYVLVGAGPVAPATTDPKKLTITISQAGQVTPPDPPNPTDVVVAVDSRTSAVTVSVADGFQFAGDVADADGAWTQDAAKKQVTFTPKSGAALGVAKSIAFRLSAMGNTATLTLLLPAQPLMVTNASRLMESTAMAPAGALLVVLDMSGKAGAGVTALAQKDGNTTVGAWVAANNGAITFTPTQLPDATTQVEQHYVNVIGGVQSLPAKVTVQFVAATAVPVAEDISRVTAARSAYKFAVVGAALGSASGGGGQWAATANEVTFTPDGTLPAGEATVSVTYTLSNAAGQPSAPKTLSLTFLAKPVDIRASAQSRVTAYTADVAGNNPGAKAAHTVRLWNGTAATDRVDVGTGGSWTVAADGKSILFTPPTAPYTATGANTQYVFGAADGTYTAPAPITLPFSNAPAAYSFRLNFPTRGVDMDIHFLDHCVIPGVFQYLKLNGQNADYTSGEDGAWRRSTVLNRTFVGGFEPIIKLNAFGTTKATIEVSYSVVDNQNVESNTATITASFASLMRFMPMAADYMVAKDVNGGDTLGADVLAGSSSFFPVDTKSVKLVGLRPPDGDTGDALLQKDGKALQVPGEGVWMVDDTGKIAFTAESGISAPPTPAWYQFADTQGNLSTPALVLFDPALSQVGAFAKKVGGMKEAAFWSGLQAELCQQQPPLDADGFLVATATYMTALAPLAEAAVSPVSMDQFDAAYQAWVAGGQVWDDAAGAAKPVGLVALCKQLVEQAAGKSAPELAVRYWRLEAMMRMVARAQPVH